MARNQFWNGFGWLMFYGANVGLGVAAYNTFEGVETLKGRQDQYVATDAFDWTTDRAKMLFHFVTEIDEPIKLGATLQDTADGTRSATSIAWAEIVLSALSTEAVVACRRAFRK